MKSVLEVYHEIAKRNPAWTAEEEKAFIATCVTRTGKWKSKACKNRFVDEAMKHNLGLVFTFLNKIPMYAHNEDLTQCVIVAMTEALKKYDPKRNIKISTWITNPIKWEIRRYTDAYRNVGDIATELAARNRRNATKFHVVSIDSEIGSSSNDGSTDTYGDIISVCNVNLDYYASRGIKTHDEEFQEKDIVDGVGAFVKEMSKILNTKERQIVRGLLKGKNMSQMATKMGLSRMRVSQIFDNISRKVRHSKYGRRLRGLLMA